MSLFGLKEKDDILALNAKITDLQAENAALQAKIPINQTELDKVSARLQEQQSALEGVEHRLELVKRELAAAKGQVVETNEAVLLQSFGLYTPHYSFMTADEYKSRLLEIRAKQKDMIKSKSAVTGAQQWTVNGSTAQGKKMISDMQKLLLRAFNAECDDIIQHVRYNNIEQSEKRITASRDAISKLGDMMRISISPQYYRLKIDELHLAFEYQQKKQEEKDALKEARARMREEATLEKELEAERAKLEKEQTHYENVLSKIIAQLDTAAEADKPALEEKIRQIETQLEKISEGFANVDYREANQRAGYVYVISNIGAFGQNVYKNGMTRR